MAEGVGFEPTVELPLLLISSQVPLTTQPPFQPFVYMGFLGCFHPAVGFHRLISSNQTISTQNALKNHLLGVYTAMSRQGFIMPCHESGAS